MSKKYHKYVFDTENRTFVGDFEGMYRAESTEGFDSWHQSDQSHITKRIALELISEINYESALDLGCGTGGLTHRLGRHGSNVIGLDVSATAIKKAGAAYGSVKWCVGDWVNIPAILESSKIERLDLLLSMEVLSYIENWQELVKAMGTLTRYWVISLYLPPEPIGFIQNHNELLEALCIHFETLREIYIRDAGEYTLVWSGLSKHR